MSEDIVICEPLRSPVGGFGGQFKDVQHEELGRQVLTALLEKTNLPGEAIEDVVLGNCYPHMETPAIGRVVALNAGLPITVPGRQVDRRCGSGLQAIADSHARISAGYETLVVACGGESKCRAPFYKLDIR